MIYYRENWNANEFLMSFLIFKEIIQHPIYFVVCHGIQCYICENQLSNDMCSSEVNLGAVLKKAWTPVKLLSVTQVSMERLNI